MKYVVVLGDGMADEPLEALGGKTPLAYAKTPAMDLLAKTGDIGMARTVPEGMSPGSDTANLSIMGYNPEIYYSGRSPLEALNIGVSMEEGDVAIRANLVTLSEKEENYEERHLLDHSADEISTEEASALLEAVKEGLENQEFQFYAGTSYRHCLIWKHGNVVPLTPPHDIREREIKNYLPDEELLLAMQKESYKILENHPINQKRREKGLNPANSLWFWGAGTKPSSFKRKFKKKGVMISAVDLLKGIAVGTGMKNISVEGANGGLHTNYEGKAQAALDALLKEGYDFAYIHVEAPDEMGHQGSVEKKIQAIEYLDERVIKLVKEGLEKSGEDYRLLILPDHPTPIKVKTHTANPVPYLLYDSRKTEETGNWYREEAGAHFEPVKGHELLKILFEE